VIRKRDLGRTVLLCLAGGSADAISFLEYETFVGAMTGNTVLLGLDLAQGRFDRAGFHFGVIAAFFLAVVLTQAALKRGIPPSVPLVLTALLLAGSDFVAGAWSAVISAIALGLQSAAVRQIAGVSVTTVFVTGNLVRLGTAVPHAHEEGRQTTLAVLATAWLTYAIGAVIGATALRLIGYPMLVPAIFALAAAMVEIPAPEPGERA